VSPDPALNRSPSASACQPYLDFIELSLSKGRNAKAIYQDLVDDHGFRGRYQSVKRFVRQLRGTLGQLACPIIVTAPGEEAQVDYGSGPMVRDPQSGRYRRTRMFVLTLGYSRKAVHLLTFQSNTRIWAELHEQAFRRLGGATRTVVLDNLGEGVLTRYLRPGAQPAVSRHARSLRRRRAALPRAPSGPQRQSGTQRRPCQEHTAQGAAL
jgi:transposase